MRPLTFKRHGICFGLIVFFLILLEMCFLNEKKNDVFLDHFTLNDFYEVADKYMKQLDRCKVINLKVTAVTAFLTY